MQWKNTEHPKEYSGNYSYPVESFPLQTSSVQYVNPFVAFEDKYAELNLGVLFSTKYPIDNSRNERIVGVGGKAEGQDRSAQEGREGGANSRGRRGGEGDGETRREEEK